MNRGDLFEPHMPDVKPQADIDTIFASGRPSRPLKAQGAVVIVTPGRKILSIGAPKPGSMAKEKVEPIVAILPSHGPLRITAIGYTLEEAVQQDRNRCIPFLGFLIGFVYVGHTVVVFEGHPSAFEAGVRDTDVLFIDSGMLPFLQDDWFEVATRVMRPDARILLHKREEYKLVHVVARTGEKADQVKTLFREPWGERSYINCLLTALSYEWMPPAEIRSDRPLPDLSALEVPDPENQLWLSKLPFRYKRLNTDRVITEILSITRRRILDRFKSTWVFRGTFVTSSRLQDMKFSMSLSKPERGVRQLSIRKI